MIEIRHVHLSYGETAVLVDVSLDVRPGELVALMGPNGSGKSTIARIMDGLAIPENGECIVDGVSTRDDPVHARLRVGLVFQDPDDQTVSRRVADDVAFGPLNLGAQDVDARVADALKAAGIAHLVDRDIHTLSGGQKQLVAIAGVLAMRPAYIVMDEPTSVLDQDGARAVVEAALAMKTAGKGILIITHDPAVAALADRIIVLKGGRIADQDATVSGDIELPELARFWNRLEEKGVATDHRELTVDGAAEALCRLKQST